MTNKNADIVREKLAKKEFIAMPGIFDMISAKIADQFNFECLYGENNFAYLKIVNLLKKNMICYTLIPYTEFH